MRAATATVLVTALSIGMVIGWATTPGTASAQVFVAPAKAEQSRVRYFDFDWMHVDILVDAKMASPRPTWVKTTSTATAAVSSAAAVLSGIGVGGGWGERFHAPDEPVTATATAALGSTATSTRTGASIEDEGLVPRFGDRRRILERSRHRGSELPPGISKAGGMRMYFYRQEDTIASRAAGSIEATYLEYTQEFGYVPRDRFPYMLYSSYQEFLQTNLFPVREGILGVTSTTDLKLALPYFGDYEMFREVSRHEMAHQFTIQKAREAAEDAEARNGLEGLPLWLVEGLAEFYAKKGKDQEAELFALDLVLNANVERGWGMLGFFEDRPGSGLWTYKIGHVRCVFLEETYGKGTIQRILEASPLLAGDVGPRARIQGFPSLLQALTGDDPHQVSAKFATWIKRRMLPTYLRARQSPVDVEVPPGQPDIIDTFTASPNGHLVMVRSLDLDTGQSKLTIFDDRAPEDDRSVAADGLPGVESLHPFAGRNFALTDSSLAFIGQSEGADVVYFQPFEHRAVRVDARPEGPRGDLGRRGPGIRLPGVHRRDIYEIELSFGHRVGFELGPKGILAAYSPAFSPDGKKIAFIGLDRKGQRDIYVLTPGKDDDFTIERITNDEYAERALSFGKSGIVFTSDRTSHGKHNLFTVRPETNAPIIPLVDEPREHLTPLALADGRIFFVAYDDARANVYEVGDSRLIQRTDFATAIYDVSPGPNGSLWGLFHHGGERKIVRVPKEKLLALDASTTLDAKAGDPEPRPHLALDGAVGYKPYAIENWHLDGLFALAGAGAGYIYGQIYAQASDRMEDHALLLQLLAYGSLDLVDGRLVYINQSGRVMWGAGPFQSLQYRFDDTVPGVSPFISYERFFGGFGVLRFPFNQFLYVQGELALGGDSYALDQLGQDALRRTSPVDTCRNSFECIGPQNNGLHYWESVNSGVRFQGRTSLSLGYSTMRYHRATGPLDGTSLLLSASLSLQPFNDDGYSLLQLDAERYFQIYGRVNFFLRGGAGKSIGGKHARQYLLYSFDTLRGVEFQDTRFLLGTNYFFSTAELQFPLNFILAFALLSDIEGVVGFDFGAVKDDMETLFDRRILDFVWGFNFGLGPLVLRLHFAKPIDTGVPLPNDGSWVTNFSLGWIYY